MFLSSSASTIVIGVVVLVVLVFVIVSSITSKKAQKVEQQKRKKVVREEIKSYLAKTQNIKNIKVEYEKVYARKGAEYKYRDVFDVVVQMYEPKTNKLISVNAYEVEGITTKSGKNNYVTAWQVNGEIDLENTKRRIAIAEKKVKLTKQEKVVLKKEEKSKAVEHKIQVKEEIKNLKAEKKNQSKNDDVSAQMDKAIKATTVKFVPRRNK
ncbi:hypothetical protein [Spiroplasma diminutum]|uniref:Uncharacterized protein n=1 Tax=Spiroplasma diminutum CUAS-1 TaxID=1276221 RepID=S5LZI7_9MOLU|nr:hypothetical protein [Spiroplasma diminutum]AGR42006.1 hypothetical protein SDIMI_v3c03020 [Spiroplasma diminutum CUAS-1]